MLRGWQLATELFCRLVSLVYVSGTRCWRDSCMFCMFRSNLGNRLAAGRNGQEVEVLCMCCTVSIRARIAVRGIHARLVIFQP